MIPALLVVTLILCVIFVWRAGHRFPQLAVLAAVVAAVLAVVLLRKPAFAVIGLALALALIYLPRLRK